MDVQVDHGDARDRPFLPQHLNRDYDIVEQAEPLAVVGERVMEPAPDMAGQAVGQP